MEIIELETRAREYAKRKSLTVDFNIPLGAGIDGTVWATHLHSAIKIFQRQENYERERDCYERLFVERLTEVNGFTIPSLIDIDDRLWIVEMEIVSPPFVLDFGKCYLDRRPDFSDEVMADWENEQRELWGDRWAIVQSIIAQLEQIGIYYQDVKPGNVMFAR